MRGVVWRNTSASGAGARAGCGTLLVICLLVSAMGCIQSLRCKPKSFRESISVLEVSSSIDTNPTSIDESSSVVLRYRTPHFRATARVLVPPVAAKETWTVGWIQACNHMEFYNRYGTEGILQLDGSLSGCCSNSAMVSHGLHPVSETTLCPRFRRKRVLQRGKRPSARTSRVSPETQLLLIVFGKWHCALS